MKKLFAVILICMASVAGAAGVITPHWSNAIIDNLVVGGSPYVDVRAYLPTGYVLDGSVDYSSQVQNAIDASVADGSGEVYFPRGIYRIDSTLTITSRNVAIIGAYADRNDADQSGSAIHFYGTGPLFQIGTDDGNYNDYNGKQGTRFENLYMKYAGAVTSALTNGMSTYGTGTYGIRDFEGGHIYGKNVTIENFEYGFWGAASDLNHWVNPEINYCKYGYYLYARSDQNDIDHGYFIYNDYAIKSERSATNNVTGLRVNNSTFVGNGTTTNAVVHSDGAWDWFFTGNWFETFSPSADNQLAYFHFEGNSGALQTRNIHIKNTTAFSGVVTSSPPGTNYFVQIGDNVTDLEISGIGYEYGLNLGAIVRYVGTTGTTSVYGDIAWITDSNKSLILSDAAAGGAITVTFDTSTDVRKRYTTYESNRQYFLTHDNYERDFFLGADADRQFNVVFPNTSTWADNGVDGRAILKMTRKIHHGDAAPASGTWEVGDIFLNTAADNVLGWKCTVAGTDNAVFKSMTITLEP